MKNKIILLMVMGVLCLGCATDIKQRQQIAPQVTYIGGDDGLVFEPIQFDPSGLPDMRDLPLPARLKKAKKIRAYTGIIKNKTKHDVSVSSANSSGTLVIPAKGWIEYTAWTKRFDLTAYAEGKPVYCLKINADPKSYPFMCKKYDFMAEILGKEEPLPGIKLKKRIRKKPVRLEIEELGKRKGGEITG